MIGLKAKSRGKKLEKMILTKIILLMIPVLGIPISISACLMFTMLPGTGGGDGMAMMKALDIPYEYLIKADKAAREENIQFSFLLAILMTEVYGSEEGFSDRALNSAISKARAGLKEDDFEFYYSVYSQYFDDLKAGPLAKGKIIRTRVRQPEDKPGDAIAEDQAENEYTVTETYYSYTSYDDFGAERSYGGERAHEGNDLIADPGVPVISVTDGIVTNLGWNEYGGNRVGITTDKGSYFYYAHMLEFGSGLYEGAYVNAGEVIGYVGDTGYGPPGTRGMFVSHLHFQIGIKLDDLEEHIWVNPYNAVMFLDQYRVMLQESE